MWWLRQLAHLPKAVIGKVLSTSCARCIGMKYSRILSLADRTSTLNVENVDVDMYETHLQVWQRLDRELICADL